MRPHDWQPKGDATTIEHFLSEDIRAFALPATSSPVDEIMVTIDRVVAGDSVPLEALNKALRIGTYPIIDEWCAERGVPKERRQEMIRIVSEKLRAVQVSIDLPEDIRAFALPATSSPK